MRPKHISGIPWPDLQEEEVQATETDFSWTRGGIRFHRRAQRTRKRPAQAIVLTVCLSILSATTILRPYARAVLTGIGASPPVSTRAKTSRPRVAAKTMIVVTAGNRADTAVLTVAVAR